MYDFVAPKPEFPDEIKLSSSIWPKHQSILRLRKENSIEGQVVVRSSSLEQVTLQTQVVRKLGSGCDEELHYLLQTRHAKMDSSKSQRQAGQRVFYITCEV